MSKPNPIPPTLTPQRIARFHSYVNQSPGQGPNGDCREWQKGRTAKGYGIFGMFKNKTRAHRLAFFLATGTWTSLCVLHHCDNPPCCNPEHLFEGTDADNSADKLRKHGHWSKKHPDSYQRGDNHFSKRHPEHVNHGEKVGTSKLTEEQALAILRSTEPIRKAAKRYGVTKSTISMIRRRVSWKHLNP